MLQFGNQHFDYTALGLNFFILLLDGTFQVEDERALLVYLFPESHHPSL